MEMNTHKFSEFGKEVKKLRAKAKKSIVDVSGAVEIEPDQLKRIESGAEKPTEDLVILLISHFELEESKALDLWKLAGYNDADSNLSQSNIEAKQIVLPLSDARVVYTDMVNVSANNYGVVINFLQGLGNNGQPMAVSRVGMSLEHAASFLKVMNDTVEQVMDQKNAKLKQDLPKDDSLDTTDNA